MGGTAREVLAMDASRSALKFPSRLAPVSQSRRQFRNAPKYPNKTASRCPSKTVTECPSRTVRVCRCRSQPRWPSRSVVVEEGVLVELVVDIMVNQILFHTSKIQPK